MKTKWNDLWKSLTAACLLAVSPLQAGLLDGQTVSSTNFHGIAPDMTITIGPIDSVVGPGTELTNFGWSGFVNIDFFDTNILITAATDQPFSYFEMLRFVDVVGVIPAFTSVTVNPATNWAGFDETRHYVTSDMIDLNLTALHGLQGQQISLDLATSTLTPGDLNCDGVVNFDDIDPFVLALSDPVWYHAAYPNCNILNGDCNRDGVVNFDDINPFVAIISGGG
jgi:hypothetical protein